MRQYAGALLHHGDKVEHLTSMMEFPLLVAMILLFMVFTLHKSMGGQSSPNGEETDSLLPQASSMVTSPEGIPGNHTPEGASSGNGTQPAETENESPTISIAWAVIGFSTGLIMAFMGLLGNNKKISNHMHLYEVSIWLLYIALFSGIIMLMNTIICKFRSTFFYGFMSLAVISGTYAISFGLYLLLPKSTFRLVIVSALPGVLFLLAAIFNFKDGIIKTAQLLVAAILNFKGEILSFWSNQYGNNGSITDNETEMTETQQKIEA